MPRSGIVGSCGSSVFSFLNHSPSLPIYIPTNSVGGTVVFTWAFSNILLTILSLEFGIRN